MIGKRHLEETAGIADDMSASECLEIAAIRADESMKAQSKVKEKGNWTFIDKIKVRLVDSDYWAEVNNFGSKFVHIQTQYVRDYVRNVIMSDVRYNGGIPQV